jgi:hypothetical protein
MANLAAVNTGILIGLIITVSKVLNNSYWPQEFRQTPA